MTIIARVASHYKREQYKAVCPPRGLAHHDQEKIAWDGNTIRCVAMNAVHRIQACFFDETLYLLQHHRRGHPGRTEYVMSVRE